MLRSFIGLLVIGLLAAATAWTAATLLDVADVLPADVTVVLERAQAAGAHSSVGWSTAIPEEGLSLRTVHGPPSGAARGIQLVLVGLLLGGPPLAVLALWLESRPPAERGVTGSAALLAGLVLQVGSLAITTLVGLLWLVELFLTEPRGRADVAVYLVFLFCSLTLCARAIQSWLILRASAPAEPLPSIVADA